MYENQSNYFKEKSRDDDENYASQVLKTVYETEGYDLYSFTRTQKILR